VVIDLSVVFDSASFRESAASKIVRTALPRSPIAATSPSVSVWMRAWLTVTAFLERMSVVKRQSFRDRMRFS
jgi:hypothetical protein